MQVPSIKTSPEFQNIARQGKRWSGASFFLQVLPTGEGAPLRFGLTASRKVGNAVTRNRAKRRLREIMRKAATEKTLAGHDIVIIAKTAAASDDFARMYEDFVRGLTKLGVCT